MKDLRELKQVMASLGALVVSRWRCRGRPGSPGCHEESEARLVKANLLTLSNWCIRDPPIPLLLTGDGEPRRGFILDDHAPDTRRIRGALHLPPSSCLRGQGH